VTAALSSQDKIGVVTSGVLGDIFRDSAKEMGGTVTAFIWYIIAVPERNQRMLPSTAILEERMLDVTKKEGEPSDFKMRNFTNLASKDEGGSFC